VPEYCGHSGTDAVVRDEEKTETPRRYRVLLHNDHYTTMEFVVLVLTEVFHKPRGEALRIMLNVHENGIGTAGVYVKQIAETKITTVHRLARDNGYPLRCSMEPD
jgi:ATP-dependent Clp protease adaptor protein ClpS